MRKPIIIGNWKMNGSIPMLKEFLEDIKDFSNDDIDYGLALPYTLLYLASDNHKKTMISASQNISSEEKGAFTGEISASMLKEQGVSYAIIGHSERREYYLEKDELINKKLKLALKSGLNPILCCGETLEERENSKHFEKVSNQLRKGLKDISVNELEKVVIAYEPIWAIGTGKSASSEDAEEMAAFIRKELEGLFSLESANKVRIQYGGSVKPSTIKDIMQKPNIDGALVGGASLKSGDYLALLNYNN